MLCCILGRFVPTSSGKVTLVINYEGDPKSTTTHCINVMSMEIFGSCVGDLATLGSIRVVLDLSLSPPGPFSLFLFCP